MIALHPVTRIQLQSTHTMHSGCFLFVGPKRSGKQGSALELANSLTGGKAEYQFRLQPENSDRGGIKVAQVRGLLADLQLAPIIAEQRRVAIIERADTMGPESANLLLKTLEEPPDRTIFILTARALSSVLPTVRSRAQIVRFLPSPTEEVDTEIRDMVITFVQGDTTQRFGVAKQLHDNLSEIPAFLNETYRVVQQRGKYDILERLLRVEESLRHNVNIRLAIEWLAMEISE